MPRQRLPRAVVLPRSPPRSPPPRPRPRRRQRTCALCAMARALSSLALAHATICDASDHNRNARSAAHPACHDTQVSHVACGMNCDNTIQGCAGLGFIWGGTSAGGLGRCTARTRDASPCRQAACCRSVCEMEPRQGEDGRALCRPLQQRVGACWEASVRAAVAGATAAPAACTSS